MRAHRRLGALGAAVLATALLASSALAAVKVSASTSKLELTTPVLYVPNTQTRVYRDYDIVVEPYRDALRTGYRVRPRAGQTTGTIETSDSDCFRNAIVNDVVCSKFSTSIAIDLRNSGEDDRVALREHQPADQIQAVIGCFARPGKVGLTRIDDLLSVAGVQAVVRLGAGDDRLSVVDEGGVCAKYEVVNRPWGIDLARLEVYGGSGDDVVAAGWGAEAKLLGESGRDKLTGGGRSDEIDGGTGNDEIDLREGDDKGAGGPGNDRLGGGPGKDVIDGGSGNDEIGGGAGDDQLRGGPGSDVVDAGDGDDVIWLDDDNTTTVATPDEVRCGAGRDTVYADPVDNVLGCEVVIRHWYTDGLPAYVTSSAITVSSTGGFLVPVRCPSQAGMRCTGTLTLRASGTSAVLGQTSYDLAVGQELLFGFQLSGARPAAMVATTSEQGQTQPRSASVALAVT